MTIILMMFAKWYITYFHCMTHVGASHAGTVLRIAVLSDSKADFDIVVVNARQEAVRETGRSSIAWLNPSLYIQRNVATLRLECQ